MSRAFLLASLAALAALGLYAYDHNSRAPAARLQAAAVPVQDVMLLGSMADQVFACATSPTPSCAVVNAYADAIIAGKVRQ